MHENWSGVKKIFRVNFALLRHSLYRNDFMYYECVYKRIIALSILSLFHIQVKSVWLTKGAVLRFYSIKMALVKSVKKNSFVWHDGKTLIYYKTYPRTSYWHSENSKNQLDSPKNERKRILDNELIINID